jgi:hypothetical protein
MVLTGMRQVRQQSLVAPRRTRHPHCCRQRRAAACRHFLFPCCFFCTYGLLRALLLRLRTAAGYAPQPATTHQWNKKPPRGSRMQNPLSLPGQLAQDLRPSLPPPSPALAPPGRQRRRARWRAPTTFPSRGEGVLRRGGARVVLPSLGAELAQQ